MSSPMNSTQIFPHMSNLTISYLFHFGFLSFQWFSTVQFHDSGWDAPSKAGGAGHIRAPAPRRTSRRHGSPLWSWSHRPQGPAQSASQPARLRELEPLGGPWRLASKCFEVPCGLEIEKNCIHCIHSSPESLIEFPKRSSFNQHIEYIEYA